MDASRRRITLSQVQHDLVSTEDTAGVWALLLVQIAVLALRLAAIMILLLPLGVALWLSM
jgi:hypothetical protein